MKKSIKNIVAFLTFERILAFILLFSTLTALIYRFYKFDFFTMIIALVSSVVTVIILKHFRLFFNESAQIAADKPSLSQSDWFWLFLAGLGSLAVLIITWAYRSDAAIVTPWELVPVWLFVVYFVAVLASLYSLRTFRLGLWLIALASFSVIPLIYTLGYGYDYFIHEASLREIFSTGVILPKTNYYFGQYTLLLILAKFSTISYSLLHLWLVPLLSAIFLPWLIAKNTADFSERVGWLLLLILPYSFLTFTTPQNFGLLLLLMEIIILSKPSKNNLLLALFLVLFNLTIHPISAIPGLTLLIMALLSARRMKSRAVFFVSAILPLAIPALLLITKAGTWSGFKSLADLFTLPAFNLPDSENIYLNLVYGYYNNLPIILILLMATAFFVYRKKLGVLMVNVGLALGLLATVILMRFIELRDVITYEQADYARRLLLIATLIVLPVIALLLIDFIKAIILLEKKYQAIWWIFLAAVLTSSFYLSYPRHDNYFNSRGLSVSRGDIEAVRYIEADSAGLSYVVLANQQVSAGSLREFGFAHYYNNNFYYPIPTTNPLYQYYLDMVYKKPSRETANSAKALAGTQKVYFVLNKYWLNFPRLLEEAKLSAVSYRGFADNTVYVFEY